MINQKLLLGFFILSYTISSLGQLPFSKQKDFYLRGDAITIGNSIMGAHPTESYTKKAKINDELKMRYIDVDKDASTFSSSSADIEIPTSSTIIYAGLYWTGTYGLESSTKRRGNKSIKYKGKGERATNFNEIRLQLPGQEYQDVQGELLFDDYSQKKKTRGRPYLCYADVTKLLLESSVQSGSYTVANVRATKGFISGGSSAGWMLYVVFENANATPKYFSTYHGLQYITGKATTFSFDNFRTPLEGTVNTGVTIGALEGDHRLYKDQVAIWNEQSKRYTPLKTAVRSTSNFFLSSITTGGKVNTKRNPASTNTLGFDIASLKLGGNDKQYIANGAESVKFQYSTGSDRFFVFFTAFETELELDFYVDKKENAATPIAEIPLEEDQKEIVVEKTTTSSPPPEEVLPVVNTKTVAQVHANTSEEDELIRKLKSSRSKRMAIPLAGYYLITNVFSEKDLALKWVNFLDRKGHVVQQFQNPKNGWYYVYTSNSLNPESIVASLREANTKPYFKDPWIFKVNID